MKTYKQKLREGGERLARRKKSELNDNNLAIAHGFRIVKEYEDAAISGATEN